MPALVAPFARFAVRAADMGARVGARDRSLAEASPLLAVLGTVDDDARAWLVAGQALQRVLLTACAFGLQASHLNQPIQVASLRPRLQQLVGAEFPQIVIRLGYSDAKVAPVPRRPVAEVIDDRP